MTTATAGVAATLVAQFAAAGVLTDPELPMTLTVTPLAGGDAVVSTTTLGHPAAGVFTYAWTPDDVDAVTDYLVTWDPSGNDLPATEVVTVLPAVVGAWATVEQALGFTGLTVTPEQLLIASSVITLYSEADISQAANTILSKDRYWLAMATSYQAVWMPMKPGLLTLRESHTSTSADGVHTQRESPSDVTLAPLAARALRNLSWIKGRDVSYANIRRHIKGSFIQESGDPYNVWQSGRIA